MKISLDAVEDLAPDQASLNAAKKLLKPTNWPTKGQSESVSSIWGQCQGSGANPYYTMADLSDHGYKCTCPSRKFPCKHVLALMWQYAEGPEEFAEGEPPELVHEWLGRRRKKVTAANSVTETEKPRTKKDIHATTPESKPELTVEELEKQQTSRAKRAEQLRTATENSVRAGIDELLQWIDDQLHTGIGGLIKDARQRCRQIAARLVDSKATALASRIDEFPALLASLDAEQQARFAVKELGQWVLLCEAWKCNPEDSDARRSLITSEKKEQLLANTETIAHNGRWEVIGERSETQRDGLISHATWLLAADSSPAKIALLLDFYPASAGRNQATMAVGTQFEGEVIYYPSRYPIRAILGSYHLLDEKSEQQWPGEKRLPSYCYTDQLAQLPWSNQCACLVGAGRVVIDKQNNHWWQCRETQQAIPISNSSLPPLLKGSDLASAFLLWNGFQAELLSAQSSIWGTLAC